MSDDPSDPPRKAYQLKTRTDFESLNAPTASTTPVDVNDLLRSANADSRQGNVNQPGTRPTEIHALLQQNLKREQAAGRFDISYAPDPRRHRRIRNFWVLLLAVDIPGGLVVWKVGFDSQLDAVFNVFLIAGLAMFTSVLIWRTWFLRTEN